MRLPLTRSSGLMASTPDTTPERRCGERPRTGSRSDGNDPARLDHLGRERANGRADRAVLGRDRREYDARRHPELANLHRLLRGHRAHLPGGRGGGRASTPARVEGSSTSSRRESFFAPNAVVALVASNAHDGRAGKRRSAASRCPPRDAPSTKRCWSNGAQPRSGRQENHVCDVRDGHRDGCGPHPALPQAVDLDPAERTRVDHAHSRPAARFAGYLSRVTATA